MIETLKNTSLYKSLNLTKNLHHAYLFSSLDKELNNNVAILFAKSLFCENSNSCGNCSGCKQFDSNSHPDFYKIDQSSIKVEDVNIIIEKLNTKPISNTHKVFLILNAENINEIAQNKLLKSLEEPNSSTIFILSSSKPDKLLPTVLSRLHKIAVPKLSKSDLLVIKDELLNQNIDISKYLSTNNNLTEILNYETNKNFQATISGIKEIFKNLNSTKDIPSVVSSISNIDKTIFLSILQQVFLCAINNQNFVDVELLNLIKTNYPTQSLINSLSHIENAYIKQMSNVNFNYILDNLLFNILKEKFLCNQLN